jgi:3-dehydro-L-gulonate-6-phosphate decarboxylase
MYSREVEVATFANHPVGIVIAGRSIVAAKDPLAAAAEFKQAIARVWPS